MPSLYSVGYSGYSGGSGYSGYSGPSGTVIKNLSSFRLTLESNTPVSTTNQESKTTLYLTPYTGKQISLYYNSVWSTYSSDEISISLSGKTANKNHDVFAYYSGSAITLELVEWTNDSTRATSLTTQDGVYVKSGDATRKYIGTIRTTGITGQCEDSFTSRYVWNMFNQVKRWGFTYNSSTSWTYASAAWREYNNGTNHVKFKFVIGKTPQQLFVENYADSTGTIHYTAIAIDTTTNGGDISYFSNGRSVNGPTLTGNSYYLLPEGYHYMTAVEYSISGTITNYGYGSSNSPGYCPVAYLDG